MATRRAAGRLYGSYMRLVTRLQCADDSRSSARKVLEMEKTGLDAVLVPEVYTFDATSVRRSR